MTYGESLLRVILDDPVSDAARLVYADHLEETGEGERAEFIRVQVELAKHGRDYNPRCGRAANRHYVRLLDGQITTDACPVRVPGPRGPLQRLRGLRPQTGRSAALA